MLFIFLIGRLKDQTAFPAAFDLELIFSLFGVYPVDQHDFADFGDIGYISDILSAIYGDFQLFLRDQNYRFHHTLCLSVTNIVEHAYDQDTDDQCQQRNHILPLT